MGWKNDNTLINYQLIKVGRDKGLLKIISCDSVRYSKENTR